MKNKNYSYLVVRRTGDRKKAANVGHSCAPPRWGSGKLYSARSERWARRLFRDAVRQRDGTTHYSSLRTYSSEEWGDRIELVALDEDYNEIAILESEEK